MPQLAYVFVNQPSDACAKQYYAEVKNNPQFVENRKNFFCLNRVNFLKLLWGNQVLGTQFL